jgi:hypothetical protein
MKLVCPLCAVGELRPLVMLLPQVVVNSSSSTSQQHGGRGRRTDRHGLMLADKARRSPKSLSHAPSMRFTASSASLASSNSTKAKPGGLRATHMLLICP